MRRWYRGWESLDLVAPEGHTGEIPLSPPQSDLVNAKVLRADEKLESLRQMDMLLDGDPRSSDREIPDFAVNHDLCPDDDLGLLQHAEAPCAAELNSAMA
jgi:hypothetical protein